MSHTSTSEELKIRVQAYITDSLKNKRFCYRDQSYLITEVNYISLLAEKLEVYAFATGEDGIQITTPTLAVDIRDRGFDKYGYYLYACKLRDKLIAKLKRKPRKSIPAKYHDFVQPIGVE